MTITEKVKAQINMAYPVLLNRVHSAGVAFLPNIKRCERQLYGPIYGIRRKNLRTGHITLISTTEEHNLLGWAMAYAVRGHENGCVLFWEDGGNTMEPYWEFLGGVQESNSVVRCLHSQEIIDEITQEGPLYLELFLA